MIALRETAAQREEREKAQAIRAVEAHIKWTEGFHAWHKDAEDRKRNAAVAAAAAAEAEGKAHAIKFVQAYIECGN
jgi:hypothetical protein